MPEQVIELLGRSEAPDHQVYWIAHPSTGAGHTQTSLLWVLPWHVDGPSQIVQPISDYRVDERAESYERDWTSPIRDLSETGISVNYGGGRVDMLTSICGYADARVRRLVFVGERRREVVVDPRVGSFVWSGVLPERQGVVLEAALVDGSRRRITND